MGAFVEDALSFKDACESAPPGRCRHQTSESAQQQGHEIGDIGSHSSKTCYLIG
jgi:hypothetical protein